MLGLTTSRRLRAADARARDAVCLMRAARTELVRVTAQRDEVLRLVEQAYADLIREQHHSERSARHLRLRLTRALESLAYWRAEADRRRRGAHSARVGARQPAARLPERGDRQGAQAAQGARAVQETQGARAAQGVQGSSQGPQNRFGAPTPPRSNE
ncbi:hypothetical protein [Actinacidiphila yeochonensis]|uniref:hypothetical protein n=1 Tax=Actinacidiphila yeochonensis TaxID=89050 RepID=UPI000560E586|nr:hypothetical protein [Actinacidiphila yeochonensis]